MKKNNILVIFFLSCFLSFIIYKYNVDHRISVLILGDNKLLNSKYKTYDTYLKDYLSFKMDFVDSSFVSENKTYKDLINNIKNNYYVVSKNKRIYLNQMISKSDYIILNANNNEYLDKCNKSTKIIENYDNKIENEIFSLIEIINKISTAKIIVISNYCKNHNLEKNIQSEDIIQIDMAEIYKYSVYVDDLNRNILSDKGNYELFLSIINSLN